MATIVDQIISLALKQVGKPYRLGAEASTKDSNPKAFDCSELLEWTINRNGIYFPDGTWAQYSYCKTKGTLISIDEAIHTKGAILFRAKGSQYGNGTGNHVGFSLGDGKTIEARSTKYGVGSFSATQGRAWTHGALIPDVNYKKEDPVSTDKLTDYEVTELYKAYFGTVNPPEYDRKHVERPLDELIKQFRSHPQALMNERSTGELVLTKDCTDDALYQKVKEALDEAFGKS